MTKVEHLNEGWVKFQRFPCKVGFIDMWIGDCQDNPNNLEESQLKLNSSSRAYRLNGKGVWKYDLPYGKKQELEGLLNIMRDVCSSDEIWKIVF